MGLFCLDASFTMCQALEHCVLDGQHAAAARCIQELAGTMVPNRPTGRPKCTAMKSQLGIGPLLG